MQPLEPTFDLVQCVAWRIDCDGDLVVTMGVIDTTVVLLSRTGDEPANWTIGTQMSAEVAHRQAVRMTGTYERMRAGQVQEPVQLSLPMELWLSSLEEKKLDPRAGRIITIHTEAV